MQNCDWNFPRRVILRRLAPTGLGVLLSAVQLIAETPVAQDTTVPNQFAFQCEVYYVDKDATNAVINVDFIPGNRSWSGAVDFSTSNATAQAGIDYEPTNGTLHFSGPGTPVPVITVPILRNESRETNVVVDLYLSNPTADIARPHAKLIIVDKDQNPPLKISPGNYGISLSWPAIYEGFVLEKSTDFSGDNWSSVVSAPTTNYNFCTVYDPFTETAAPAFYRLRKSASP